MALVEPPLAIRAVAALSKASGVRMRSRRRSSQTISTMRLPHSPAMRGWAESGAGMLAAPGRDTPSASHTIAMVEAVPIVMQVPWERAMLASTSACSSAVMRPARRSSQNFHWSEPEPSVCPRQRAVSMGPAGRKMVGRPMLVAPMTSAGVVLSQPPSSTTPSMG